MLRQMFFLLLSGPPCLCGLSFFTGFTSFTRHETVLRGFLAVQNGAAGAAHSHTRLNLVRADRAVGQRLGIIEPRLFGPEMARGTALEIGDEHGIFAALP